MRRKVVQQGPTTLMVSLPIKWARKYNLERGDEVELSEADRKLVISTEKKQKESKSEINLDSVDRTYIWRCLQAQYITGYDEIKINFSDPRALGIIQDLVISSLIGFEVIDQEKTYCLIKSVSTEQSKQFSDLLRKVFLNLLHISELIRYFLEKREDPSMVSSLELTNNRHTMFLKRILNKEGHEDPKKTIFYFNLIVFLEKIANEYKFLVQDINHKKANLSKSSGSSSILSFYLKIDKEFLALYDCFYKYDDEKAKKIILDNVREEEMKPLLRTNPEIAYYFMKITDFIRTSLFQVTYINS
jgi:phosphate uptake regulator